MQNFLPEEMTILYLRQDYIKGKIVKNNIDKEYINSLYESVSKLIQEFRDNDVEIVMEKDHKEEINEVLVYDISYLVLRHYRYDTYNSPEAKKEIENYLNNVYTFVSTMKSIL
jgi:hypothetical protein